MAFTDHERKIRSYVGFIVGGHRETPTEKQKKYENNLKQKKRHLVAWKEEIELNKEIKKDQSKLDKINSKITETGVEADRRENVARSKFYGSVIELLDMQRKALKDKEQTDKLIVEMQKDIADIKEMLSEKCFDCSRRHNSI